MTQHVSAQRGSVHVVSVEATPALEHGVAGDDLLSAFDVDEMSTEVPLFQTGYLTITGETEADMAVLFDGQVWLFEFKRVEDGPEGTALTQLKAKRYADKYRDRNEPIHLIGMEFSRAERNLVAFTADRA